MGTTFNARSDTYGQARRHSNETLYVFAEGDLPDAVSGIRTLTPDIVYEIDKVLDLVATLLVENNTIRGDGSVNNRINWNGSITALQQTGNYELNVDDLFLGNQNEDATLFDLDGDGVNPRQAAVNFKNGCVIRDFASMGTCQAMRVSFRDTDVLQVGAGIDLVNTTIVRMSEMNWLFNEGTGGAPDYCIRIRNDFNTNTRRVRDVALMSLTTNAEMGTNPDAAFFDISPNLGSAIATVLIAGCTLQGSDPVYPFALGDEDEITAVADAGGGFVTISTADTGSLANGDWVNILRTENYNGGYEVSNVVANTSFDIEETFVDNPGRGTWHTGSLDQRDPRIQTRDNIGIMPSRSIFAAYENDNAAVTTLGTQDTWAVVQFDDLLDGAPFVERFALCGDGTEAEFIYHGRDDLKGTINVQMRCVCDSGGNSLDDFEFGWGLNGAEPANLFRFERPNVSANLSQDFIFNQGYIIERNDKLKLWVKCTTDSRDLIVSDFACFTNEI